jgi:hypothetical protein
MRLWFKQFGAIAGLTALETIRQPICFILAVSCIAFITLLPLLTTHTLNESQRMVRDSAMALHFVTGLILGAYAACASINHEIRRGTVSAILSKPVGRDLFFLSKFSGIAVVMVLFSAGAMLATLLSDRTAAQAYRPDWWSQFGLVIAILAAMVVAGLVNYFLHRPFVSNAFVFLLIGLAVAFTVTSFVDREGAWTTFGQEVSWTLIPAGLLITMAILVLTSIAVSLATRLDVVPTVTICSVVFLLGLMSDYFFGRYAGEHRVAAVLYTLTPNWQHFWGADALAREGIPLGYLASAGGYGLLYLAGILCLGMVAFRNMEVRA